VFGTGRPTNYELGILMEERERERERETALIALSTQTDFVRSGL